MHLCYVRCDLTLTPVCLRFGIQTDGVYPYPFLAIALFTIYRKTHIRIRYTTRVQWCFEFETNLQILSRSWRCTRGGSYSSLGVNTSWTTYCRFLGSATIGCKLLFNLENATYSSVPSTTRSMPDREIEIPRVGREGHIAKHKTKLHSTGG